MRTSEKTDLLMPALLAARSHMTPAAKDGRNEHFRYDYATEQSWHDAVQPPLLDRDLFLSFSVTDSERTGNLTTVRGTARVTHVSGQWLEVGGVGEGSDNADKGAYKAMTGFKKYCYALCFALPTTDDAEHDSNDRARVKQTTFKAAKDAPTPAPIPLPEKSSDQVNAERVAAGQEPIISLEEKTAASASYQILRKLDKDWAKAVKHECGTDYRKMKTLLDTAIKKVQERTANESQPQ